jgi:hypothetical protein
MYKRYCILIILALFLSEKLPGQKALTFPEVDSASYGYYLSEDWDSIIYINKLARKNDISYYYLDLRVGIAKYEKQQYRQATQFFRKALSQNNSEDIPKEYLYYAYSYSGQNERADLLSKKFSSSLSEKIPPAKPVFLKSVFLEAVYSMTDGDKYKDQLWGESNDGVRMISNNMQFIQLGLTHQPAVGLSIKHGLSYLHKNNLSYIRSEASEVYFPDLNLNQLDYFIIPEISLKSGLSINPSFHYTYMSSEVMESVDFGYGQRASARTNIETRSFFIGGLELKQSLWLFDISAALSLLSLNGISDYQKSFGFRFYPLGNLKLFLGADYYITDNQHINLSTDNNIWHTIVGWTIKEKIWIEASYTEGNMIDFREKNNKFFYNSPDYMNRKAQLHFIVPRKMGKGVIYFGARWANTVSPYYMLEDNSIETGNSFEYNGYTFYGGISWNI